MNSWVKKIYSLILAQLIVVLPVMGLSSCVCAADDNSSCCESACCSIGISQEEIDSCCSQSAVDQSCCDLASVKDPSSEGTCLDCYLGQCCCVEQNPIEESSENAVQVNPEDSASVAETAADLGLTDNYLQRAFSVKAHSYALTGNLHQAYLCCWLN